MRADRRLLASGRVASAALVAAIVLGVLTAGLAVAQAGLLARTISGAFMGGEDASALAVPLAALALVLVGRALIGWAAEIVAQRISSGVKSDLRRRLLAHAAALGPRWASAARSGEVVLLATRGLDALDGYFARYLPQLALAVIVPVVVVACPTRTMKTGIRGTVRSTVRAATRSTAARQATTTTGTITASANCGR